MREQTTQSTIYIGLNDADTGEQRFQTEKYLSILKNVCRNYQVAFSVHGINGGYFHEDGRYTEENVPEQTVIEIARDLCAFFHQESVLVTTAPCKSIFVKERLDNLPG